jgi:hypothetical protein
VIDSVQIKRRGRFDAASTYLRDLTEQAARIKDLEARRSKRVCSSFYKSRHQATRKKTRQVWGFFCLVLMHRYFWFAAVL